MISCKIQWVGPDGKATPDENPAIGYVYCEAYRYPDKNACNGYIQYEETEHYPICTEHAKQLRDPGMVHWRFLGLDGFAVRTLSCGCCTNGCCCQHHQDVPRGQPVHVCGYHQLIPHPRVTSPIGGEK